MTTLTEESSDIIPLIFRGKQIETTLVSTQTRFDQQLRRNTSFESISIINYWKIFVLREITATEYSTEVVTQTQAPPVSPGLQLPIVPQLQQQPQADLLGNILPDLLNIPELALYPDLAGVQSDDQYDSLENLINDLDPRLLAALDENINFNKEPEPVAAPEIVKPQPQVR